MRIVCNTQELTDTCLNVQRCVPSKAVMPHLEGILIQTEGQSSIMLSGFDLELGITTHLEARVERPGAAVLNAKKLCDILRKISSRESVVIDCDEKNVCTIQSGNTNYTLSGTLTVGTSTLTVSYGGKTTTFSVTVTQRGSDTDYWADGVAYRNIRVIEKQYCRAMDGAMITSQSWCRRCGKHLVPTASAARERQSYQQLVL